MWSTIFPDSLQTLTQNLIKTIFGKIPRLKAGALLLIMVSAILLNFVSPAMAGADINGVNWCGKWHTIWSSPTGKSYSPIKVYCWGQVGSAKGEYNNGTMEGWTYYDYDNFGNVKALKFDGIWRRKQGDSGGPCNYGQFSLDLTASDTRGKDGFPLSDFHGQWSYCKDPPTTDPANSKKSWPWYGWEER